MSSSPDHNFGAQFVPLDGHAPTPKRRQVALVPGAQVPVLTLELPSGLRGQAREQVARRQLQDRVGLGSEAVEMRPFQLNRAQGWTKVLVADATRMIDWRKDAGRNCRAMLPDYLALPAGEGLWTLTKTQTGVAMRLGPQDGFSARSDVAAALVTDALADTKPRAALRLGDPLDQIEALLKEQGVPIATSLDELRGLDVEAPKVLGHGELSLDLRRDPQMARTRMRRQVLPWRWPLLVGAIAAGLWGYAQNLETKRITDATRLIRVDTQQLVKTHFVTSGPVLDVRTQVSRALVDQRRAAAGGQSQASSLDLLARASDVIALEGATPRQFSATSNDDITVVLRVDDFVAADRIANAFVADGLAVEIVESRVSDTGSGVRTELRLRTAEVPE
ncbi:type II secretion system protein GspL [Pseudosulfitobacter sp. SM2401]|uniref:type II secretion system protein GspL n=1 Tax=Pseudosulfitobacter sp. SM2401 TaxID=3350098 RepID=UPI0036F270A4